MKKIVLMFMILVALGVQSEEFHECTSWMVFSDLTENGVNILHKNRDNHAQKVSAVMSSPNAKRKWVGLGNPNHNSPTMGLNESGLAVAVNSGEKTNYHSSNPKGKNTVRICKEILENCGTAEEAVKKLKSFIDAKDYNHRKSGSIFLFMDAKEGYICEITAHYVAARKYDKGYICRANRWRFPEMDQFSNTPVNEVFGSSLRESIVKNSLKSVLRKGEKIDVEDIINIARDSKLYAPAKTTSAVCGKKTLSALTMVIDKEFPDVLSYGYALIGYPRHTICVPLPICIDKLPIEMVDGSWSAGSYKNLAKLGRFNKIPVEWIEFEKESRVKFEKTLAAARELVRNNKKHEAIKLLNQTALEIWQGAEKFVFNK